MAISRFDLRATLEAAFKTGVNLFLGAGFSLYARDHKNHNLPAGATLAAELINYFGLTELSSLSLDRLCEVMKAKDLEKFNEFLVNRFRVQTYDKKYDALIQINTATIFTTNIDNLINKIYAKSAIKHVNDLVLSGAAHRDTTAVDFIPLHGHVDHPIKHFDFGTVELASAFARDPDRFRVLTHKLQTHPTLYWGYGMNDAGPLNALEPRLRDNRPIKPKWILLREPGLAEIEYFSALKFNIIIGDTADMLDLIGGVKAAPKLDPTHFLEQFASDRIPTITDVPPRPSTAAFLGAAPSWYDVLGNRLYKTAHYSELIDRIHAGRNILIVGIPQCGKTTLLMQIASGLETTAHVLFPGHLTSEKAVQIGNATSGHRKAIIFVDDASASVLGLNALLSCSTVQAVAADRNLSIEIVGHLLNRKNLQLYDASDLKDDDVAAVIKSIPASIAIEPSIVPEVAQGRSPSIFEIIAKNVRGRALVDKYRDILRELERKNRELHDLFVMICYLRACRTPVSFEVAWAFLGVHDYKDVYARMEALGALLAEFDATLDSEIESNQDFFVARSDIIARAVIEQCSQQGFRRVFERFHEQVSPFRIPEYGTFKRAAYDADFATKAFPDWNDGAEFYKRIFEIDENYYLLQQGALYLKGRNRFKEAFQFIDRALEMSRGLNPRIKNTHAIILFDANLSFAGSNPEARRSLEDAMQILQRCRTLDKRRSSYHAYTFADQATRYFDIFPDQKGKQYLLLAEKWLNAEMRDPLARRRARGYLARVNQRLGNSV
jgi:hypothetical protein